MSRNLTPTEVAERLIGPPDVLGAIIGMGDKAAYGWRHGSKFRDAGDFPSPRHMRALLAHAAARGIPLRAEHLIWGADAAEIEALASALPAVLPAVRAAE